MVSSRLVCSFHHRDSSGLNAVNRVRDRIRNHVARLGFLMPSSLSKPRNYESALVIPVPTAEDQIGGLRRRFEPSGMFAHVTVLYPFVAAALISSDVVEGLREVLSGFKPFAFELSEIGWFEDSVLFLAPTPRASFEELTALVVERFPDYQPYRGAFDEIIPHLTIGESGRPTRLRRAALQLSRQIPITALASEVYLMVPDRSGHWQLYRSFPLGSRS